MFIREKPIRFGCKDWMLCSYDGYPFKLILYQEEKQPETLKKNTFRTQVINEVLNDI